MFGSGSNKAVVALRNLPPDAELWVNCLRFDNAGLTHNPHNTVVMFKIKSTPAADRAEQVGRRIPARTSSWLFPPPSSSGPLDYLISGDVFTRADSSLLPDQHFRDSHCK